jgi:uncharacterized protein
MFAKLEKQLEHTLARAEHLIDRVEALLPTPRAEPDWRATAYRWRRARGASHGTLAPVLHPHVIRFDDLKDIDDQKARLDDNTRQFVRGHPANNILLTGSRGTGKSSLVKAALHRYAAQGLRLIEVDRSDLIDLPEIADLIAARQERFIIFSDDLSFEANDPGYKALKSALDGGISAVAENMVIYATSNRRHLMPEKMSENLDATHTEDGEIHPGETTEEKISLSERFGLWLSFYPFGQEQYLDIARHWVDVLTASAKQDDVALQKAALLWALERGSRSGRVAYQFARDWAGQHLVTAARVTPTRKRSSADGRARTRASTNARTRKR